MNKCSQKYWIGVACKEHVANGVKHGICQFCHGKSAPANRPSKGDFLLYYSSKHTMADSKIYQKFTAIGIIQDEKSYQVDMGNGFKPFRRHVNYLEAKHIAIRPLVQKLPFIKNKKSWGYVFRYGFLEIDRESFNLIAERMLTHTDLAQLAI